MSDASNQHFCGDCGSPRLNGDLFCGSCGARFAEAANPPTTAAAPRPTIAFNQTTPPPSTAGSRRRVWIAVAAALVIVGAAAGITIAVVSSGDSPSSQPMTTGGSASEAQPTDSSTASAAATVPDSTDTVSPATNAPTTSEQPPASTDGSGPRAITSFAPSVVIGNQSGKSVRTVRISPDKTRVLTAGFDSTASVWSIDSDRGVPFDVFTEHTKWVYEAAYNRNGRLVATVSEDGTLIVRNSQTHEAPCGTPFVTSDQGIDSVRFFPNSNWLVTGDQDGWVRVWDVDTCTSVTDLWFGLEVFSVDVSADGSRIAAAGGDNAAGAVRMWAVDEGFAEFDLQEIGHKKKVRDVTFSPDGPFLVTTSKDGTAVIWDLRQMSRIATLRHNGYVQEASFSSDGRYLVTTNDKGSPRVWDVSALWAGDPPIPIAALDNTKVWSAVFIPGTYSIVTGGYDGKIIRWDPVA